MPELPEVETIARQLNVAISGLKVVDIKIFREKIFEGNKELVVGKKIKEVKRRAKIINIIFEDKSFIQIHLKMTGQLIYIKRTQGIRNSRSQDANHLNDSVNERRIVGGHPTSDWVSELPSKHTRVEFVFDDGSNLYFNDIRAFGWVKVIEEVGELDSKKNVPDVIDESFTVGYFEKVLQKISRPIKVVLLDQQIVGGVGNIYANDALNMAMIMPDRKSSSLTREEISALYKAVKFVIELGIEKGGASAANYVDTRGLGGSYQDFFLVYKREGEKCKNCAKVIQKMTLAGRGTFYCPNCQV